MNTRAIEKLLAAGLTLPIAVFDVAECLLLHFPHRLSSFHYITFSRRWKIKSAFPYVPDIGFGIMIWGAAADDDVQRYVTAAKRHGMDSADNFISYLSWRAECAEYIPTNMIELANCICPAEVERYKTSNAGILRLRREKEAVEKAEQAAAEAEYVAEKNREAQAKVDAVVRVLQNDGIVENTEIEIFRSRYDSSVYSVVNHLMRLYGIRTPLRTQGWINDKLVTATIKDGVCDHVQYRKSKNGKCSQVVFRYLTELAQAARKGAEYSNEPEYDKVNHCIGHVRGDFDTNRSLHTTWWPHQNDVLNTPRFKADLQRVVEWLRKGFAPLKDLETMGRFCSLYESAAKLPGNSERVYGFRVDSEHYMYALRCTPEEDAYHVYLYCYGKNDKMSEPTGTKYIDARGWKYKVMGGIGPDRFKARYQKPDKDDPNCGWKGVAAVPWREGFAEAQADLDRLAKERGWEVWNGQAFQTS